MSEARSEIFLRPLGSPLPVGLAGLTVASLVVSGLDLGWVSVSAGHEVGLMLLVAGVPLQLIGLLYALPARDAAAATSMGVLTISWLGMGLTRLLSPPGSVSHSLGLVLLATGGLLACSAAGQAAGKPLLGLTLATAAARLILSGLHELLGSGGLQTVSGIVGLVVAGFAAYMVVALELEDARDHAVLPVIRRGRARRSTTEQAPDADGAVREAGVRPQL
jgi:succinate-acetate transporter protein